MESDNSSAITPVGDTYRGFGSSWFNAKSIAKEDFQRDIQMIDYQNKFNAEQAQIDRDFQERMSNTAYQRAIADMKAAGLNPVLMYQQGSASQPQGARASSSGVSRTRSAYEDGLTKLVAGLLSLGGMIGNVVSQVAGSPTSTGYKGSVGFGG